MIIKLMKNHFIFETQSYMSLAERVTHSPKSLSRYGNDHIDCNGNNHTFEWMPNVGKRYLKP